MRRKLKLAGLLLLSAWTAEAQQLQPAIINSGGRSSSNGGVLLEYSVGGLMVTNISTPVFMYTQDFLQPDAGTTTTVPPIGNVSLSGNSFIDNAGTTFVNGNLMIEFTVGEVASITLSASGKMLTQGILQPQVPGTPLSVHDLEFYATRLNNSEVRLNWQTMRETNSKGFHIERQHENEKEFSDLGFVASNATSGYSNFPLDYVRSDINSFSGTSYYRLKQEDLNGAFVYSIVRAVNGSSDKTTALTVWPVPADGYFNFSVSGIEKRELVYVLDASGKVVRQISVEDKTEKQVTGLTPGMYIVSLASDRAVSQKVILR